MSKKHTLVALAATATIAGGSAAAYASTVETDSSITACYAKKDGALRYASGGTCKSTEVPISWNKSGPAGLVWKGTWDAGTTYAARDAVIHDGSSYVAAYPSTGSVPPSSQWTLLAAAGEQGERGEPGTAGTSAARSAVGEAATVSYLGETPVVTLNLPAGNHVVNAAGTIAWTESPSQAGVTCWLAVGSSHLPGASVAEVHVSEQLRAGTAALTGAVSLAEAAQVSVACRNTYGPNFVTTRGWALTATEVDTLS